MLGVSQSKKRSSQIKVQLADSLNSPPMIAPQERKGLQGMLSTGYSTANRVASPSGNEWARLPRPASQWEGDWLPAAGCPRSPASRESAEGRGYKPRVSAAASQTARNCGRSPFPASFEVRLSALGFNPRRQRPLKPKVWRNPPLALCVLPALGSL